MPVFLSIFRVTDRLFYNQLWIEHLTRKFHGDIFFQIEYFCGEDGKKKGRNRKFLRNKEIRQDQCQDQFCLSSFSTKEMKHV